MNRPAPPLGKTWYDWLVVVLVLGYCVYTRTFAHIGVAPLYVGEVALALFLFARPHPALRPLFTAQLKPTPISAYSWWFVLFAGYGVIELLRGVAEGHDRVVALQSAVVHIYPLFFFVGNWVACQNRKLLSKLVWWLAWANGVYGTFYVALIYPGEDTMVGAGVGFFGQPRGATIAILGLLCFQRRWSKIRIPLLLNAFVLVGMQGRSEWLSLAAGLLVWGILAGRFGVLVKVGAVATTCLLCFLVVDVPLPMRNDEGETMTTHNIVGFAIAVVDVHAAKELTPHAVSDASTVSWRTSWWASLWGMVHETPNRALFGPAYGYPIWEHHEEALDNFKLRTPHNSFVFALSYTGWVGVVLLFGLLASLGWVLWRVFKLTGQPFGICFLIMMLVRSMADPFFETPYLGIPFWLITGLAAAPLMAKYLPKYTERDLKLQH